MTPRIAFLLALTLLTNSACSASIGSKSGAMMAAASGPRLQHPGLAFAQARCAGCHSVAHGVSPNPQAPTFEAVINTPELDLNTLNSWLRNSHNFPEVMNFTIDPVQIDDLARYMLTLRDPGYRPGI